MISISSKSKIYEKRYIYTKEGGKCLRMLNMCLKTNYTKTI